MKTFKTKKGTEIPLLDLRGKDYLQVPWRVFWMREENPQWRIVTKLEMDLDKKGCLARAEIYDETGKLLATAHKYEDQKGFPDFIEKSETGAIGRALALCGYGTQFAPELSEETRLADSPLEKKKNMSLANPPTPNFEEAFPEFGDAPKDEIFETGKNVKDQLFSAVLKDTGYVEWVSNGIKTNFSKMTNQQKRFYAFAKFHGATK